MKEVLFIEGRRTGYTPKQCDPTMTVGELIAHLEMFDEDTPVYLNNDNGYTYGEITETSFDMGEIESDEDEEEDEEEEDD